MRLAAVICSASLVSLAAVAPAAATAKHTTTGALAGRTKINTGCPGPVSPGGCNPWHPLPHATFTITRLSSAAAEIAATTRTVRSNSDAAFRVLLRVGSYLVKPTPETNRLGGPQLRVHIAARATTETTVRFTAKIRLT